MLITELPTKIYFYFMDGVSKVKLTRIGYSKKYRLNVDRFLGSSNFRIVIQLLSNSMHSNIKCNNVKIFVNKKDKWS